MAANPWTIHDAMIEYLHDNSIDVENDTLVMRLYTVGSTVNDSTLIDASTATNELGTANGYTAGGTPVTITISRVGGVIKVGCTNGSWTASGAGMTARFAAIVDTTPATDVVLFSTLLDNTPADATAQAGSEFLVQINTNGIYLAQQP